MSVVVLSGLLYSPVRSSVRPRALMHVHWRRTHREVVEGARGGAGRSARRWRRHEWLRLLLVVMVLRPVLLLRVRVVLGVAAVSVEMLRVGALGIVCRNGGIAICFHVGSHGSGSRRSVGLFFENDGNRAVLLKVNQLAMIPEGRSMCEAFVAFSAHKWLRA